MTTSKSSTIAGVAQMSSGSSSTDASCASAVSDVTSSAHSSMSLATTVPPQRAAAIDVTPPPAPKSRTFVPATSDGSSRMRRASAQPAGQGYAQNGAGSEHPASASAASQSGTSASAL